MKKILKRILLLAAMLLACAVQSRAITFSYNGLKYTTLTDSTCETTQGYYDSYSTYTAGNKVSGELVIPETVYDENGTAYTVTKIGDYAFCKSVGLTSVTIPNSILYIGQYAFLGCTKLSEVIIPDSVIGIYNLAFSGCTKLSSVIIGNSVKIISEHAFDDCNNLVKTAYPSSIENPFSTGCNIKYPEDGKIEDGIVWGANKSAIYFVPYNYTGEVTIPNSVTEIGSYAFSGCTGLTGVIFDNSVTEIGSYAFSDCTGLTVVIFGNSVTEIGFSAFRNCSCLTELTIPSSVTSIGGYAFQNCSGISEINILDSNTELSLDFFAFIGVSPTKLYLGRNINKSISGGTNLRDLTIGTKVTSICKNAFSGCSDLTEVTIPYSVVEIGDNAFANCTGIKELNFEDHVNEVKVSSSAFDYVKPTTIYYGRNISAAVFNRNSKLTNLTFGYQVTSIVENAFEDCWGLTSIVIPKSVKKIGSKSFWDCLNLQFIESRAEIPPTIQSDTFSDYSVPLIAASGRYKTANYWENFINITIPYTPTDITFETDGLKCEIISINDLTCRIYDINEYAFGDSLIIPETVEFKDRQFKPIEIKGKLITGKTRIKSVSIPSCVNSIASGIIWNTTLDKLIINTSITENISVSSTIGEVVISPSATKISADFSSNTISKITIEDSYKSLTTNKFNCDGLKEVYLGRNVSAKTFFLKSSIENVSISSYVTEIGDSLFFRCNNIKELKILGSNTKLTIGTDAFDFVKPATVYLGRNINSTILKGNTNLISLTIGGKVTSIVANAFSGCTNIDELNIEDSEQKLTIGTDAFKEVIPTTAYLGRNISSTIFKGNYNLCSLTIGDKVTSIVTQGFCSCQKLAKVTIPNSVTEIGGGAFYGCSGLTEVTIPNSVTEIGESAFEGCDDLEKVNITDLEAWCEISFCTYSKYSNPLYYAHHLYLNDIEYTELEIPESITSIGNYAFCGCSGLTSVKISSSVTSIGAYAFYDCTGLTSVTIPNSVTEIGSSAFAGCTGLTSVTIPNSVTEISSSAFAGCTGLIKSVYPSSLKNPFSKGITISYPKNGLVENGIVFDASKTTLYFVPIQYQGKFDIPNSVTSIGSYAFAYCTGMTSVTFPNSVTEIGDEAFVGCLGLIDLSIGNSVTCIGNSAFYRCTALTSVSIPNSVVEIGENTFQDCKSLHEATIGNSITSINNSAFYGCSSLTSIVLPNSVTAIGKSAFRFCYGLSSIKIPNSVKKIDDYAFSGCYNLTTVAIPNSVTEIGASALSGCSSLTEVTIPNSVVEIGDYVFSGCSSITSITFMDGNERLSNSMYAFGSVSPTYVYFGRQMNFSTVHCTAMETVEFGANVTSITNGAFKDSSKIRIVNVYNTTPPSTDDIFSNDTYLYGYLYVPEASIDTYKDATGWKNFWNIYAVSRKVKAINVDKTSASVYVTKSETITANIIPDFADNQNVIWSVSDKSIATISIDATTHICTVTGVSAGSCNIIAKSAESDELIATCELTVLDAIFPESIELSEDNVTLYTTNSATITATISPSIADNQDVIWSVSDESVATISIDETTHVCTVIGVSAGTCYIVAKSAEKTELTAVCKITVLEKTYPESIELSDESITLHTTSSATITATISPSFADNQDVIWSVSDESVATILIDETTHVCTVIGVSAGTCYIVAKSAEKTELTAVCKITVLEKTYPESIELSEDDIALYTTDTATITATISPSIADNQDVIWSVSDESVATISIDGTTHVCTVIGVSAGTCYIVAKSAENAELKDVCKITVLETTFPESIQLNKDDITLQTTNTATITATIRPLYASNRNVMWSVSDESVATIAVDITSHFCTVTAVAPGTCYIVAKSAEKTELTAACKITVLGATYPASIELSENSITLLEGDSHSISASLSPSDVDVKTVTWSSSDEEVATVSESGNITGVTDGICDIIATTANGLEAVCHVIVIERANPVFYEGLVYNLNKSDKTAVVTYASSNPKYSGDVVIPPFIVRDGVEYMVTEIGEEAFSNTYGNNNVAQIVVPYTVKSIAYHGFLRCQYLTNGLVLGRNVSSIGEGATGYTTSNHIISLNPTPPTMGKDCGWNFIVSGSIYVPKGSKTAYQSANIWSGKSSKIMELDFVSSISVGSSSARKAASLYSNTLTMKVGEKYVPEINVEPEDAYTGAIYWKSSDESVAHVSEHGKITAYSEGECTIKAIEVLTGASATINVKVLSQGAEVIDLDAVVPADFSVDGGAICVSSDVPVRIVAINGRTVYSGRGEARVNVSPGFYVVIIGNTAHKICVK